MSACDILLTIGYLLICATAFFGHLLTLFVKIKKGDTWTDNSIGFNNGKEYQYKFSFYENIVGWGLASFVPFFNIGMIIYDVVYLINPFIKFFDKFVNDLMSAEGHD